MKFYLKDFFVFITVAETKSLSKAATMLGMSVSSVSKRISRLESYLQTVLFDRSTRHLKLSAVGESAYEKSVEMTSLFDDFIREIKSSDIKLRVCSQHDEYESYIIDWVYRYCRNNRNVTITVDSGCYENHGMDLNEVFVAHERSQFPLAIHRRLSPIKRIICCSGHFTDSSKLLRPDKIIDYGVIFFRIEDKDIILTHSDTGEKFSIHTDGVHVNSIDLAIKSAAEKDCVIIGLPDFVVRKYIDSGLLSEVMTDWTMEELPAYLIWKDRPYYKDAFTDFINYFESKWNLGVIPFGELE